MEIISEDAYESQFLSFLEAVRILEQPAALQCERMGNYNVAWELKDDLGVGEYILNEPACSLTEGQALAVSQLIESLVKLPKSILVSATTPEENLRAMSHSAWVPLRRQAMRIESLTRR